MLATTATPQSQQWTSNHKKSISKPMATSESLPPKDVTTALISFYDMEIKNHEKIISLYNQLISRIDAQLATKEEIIKAKNERIDMLKAEISRLNEQLKNQEK
jgi:uncharacterized small protein (DUF1192 family)